MMSNKSDKLRGIPNSIKGLCALGISSGYNLTSVRIVPLSSQRSHPIIVPVSTASNQVSVTSESVSMFSRAHVRYENLSVVGDNG